MKSRWIILALALIVFSIVVFSQASETKVVSLEINDKFTIDKKQYCTYTQYEEDVAVYANVTLTRPVYGTCFDVSNQSYYQCQNGTEEYQNYQQNGTIKINKTNEECKSGSFTVVQDNSRKEVDFSSWGVCVQSLEDECVVITCGTLEGGSARNGIFNGCDGGKQCKKFLFCEDKTYVLVKGSSENFAIESPAYLLPTLEYKEVG